MFRRRRLGWVGFVGRGRGAGFGRGRGGLWGACLFLLGGWIGSIEDGRIEREVCLGLLLDMGS